uniref:(northern house mosquito) hypothetical protein n=1 Tax=Culex pipiens TaxID=7175 RepID=A0A8D8IKU0_CULPI
MVLGHAGWHRDLDDLALAGGALKLVGGNGEDLLLMLLVMGHLLERYARGLHARLLDGEGLLNLHGLMGLLLLLLMLLLGLLSLLNRLRLLLDRLCLLLKLNLRLILWLRA